MQSLREWISVITPILLAIVGAYFSYNYDRQQRLRLASRRLEAYSKLWEATKVADPHRLEVWAGLIDKAGTLDGPLTESERRVLHETLTTWYYTDGNGMLLSKLTRTIYLTAKYNLICYDAHLEPPQFRAWLERTGRIRRDRPPLTWEERGCFSIWQLSLLHTQMKIDLAIYGLPFTEKLAKHEIEFLRGCHVNLLRNPWRGAIIGRRGWEQWSGPEGQRAKNCVQLRIR